MDEQMIHANLNYLEAALVLHNLQSTRQTDNQAKHKKELEDKISKLKEMLSKLK